MFLIIGENFYEVRIMRLKNIPAARPAIEASPFCVTEGSGMAGRWRGIFKTATEADPSADQSPSAEPRPLHIEIGMGKGKFIMALAKSHPEIDYLGIEKYESVMYRGLQKFEKEDPILQNLRFFRADAELINQYFAPGEVDRIYLNFSDPWPKGRHAKRRLTSPAFLTRYDQILANGGRIEFKTDNTLLFEYSVETVMASPVWQITALTRDLHHDPEMNRGNIMTEYEEKFSALGNPICKMVMERKDA